VATGTRPPRPTYLTSSILDLVLFDEADESPFIGLLRVEAA
jgi:hypothetical protein